MQWSSLPAAPTHHRGSSPTAALAFLVHPRTTAGALLVRLCASPRRRGSSANLLLLCMLALLATPHACRTPPCACSWRWPRTRRPSPLHSLPLLAPHAPAIAAACAHSSAPPPCSLLAAACPTFAGRVFSPSQCFARSRDATFVVMCVVGREVQNERRERKR